MDKLEGGRGVSDEQKFIELRDGLLSIYHGLELADCDHISVCKMIKKIALKRLIAAGVLEEEK